MLHETIFNATLLATLESRLLLDKYGGQRVKNTSAEIIQVLLLVDDLEGQHNFLLIELYDLPASSNRAPGIVIFTGPSSFFNKLRHLVCLLHVDVIYFRFSAVHSGRVLP